MTSIHELVSDGTLRMFLAAAHAGSFTLAADDVGVSQSAVSHAIARLERSLGTSVFERRSTGVVLTDVGRRLHDDLQPGFDQVDRAVHAARDAQRPSVTLSVSTSLASLWLLPRLAWFKREHPDIEVRCHTNDTDRAVGRDQADIWIPLGLGPWPGMNARHFCDEEIILVAAPQMAELWNDAPTEDLLNAPLLHLDERYRPRFDWQRWFHQFQATSPRRLPGPRSNDYSLIVQAATDGQGIALGWVHLVSELIAEGKLRQVGTGIVRTDQPFNTLIRATTTPNPSVETFTGWLVEHAPALKRHEEPPFDPVAPV